MKKENNISYFSPTPNMCFTQRIHNEMVTSEKPPQTPNITPNIQVTHHLT